VLVASCVVILARVCVYLYLPADLIFVYLCSSRKTGLLHLVGQLLRLRMGGKSAAKAMHAVSLHEHCVVVCGCIVVSMFRFY
jgi:hypothetical protein